jgi:hypothetical protein
VNIRLVEQVNKANIRKPESRLAGGKRNCWKGNIPIILSHDVLEYLHEVKRFLPEGNVSTFELQVAKQIFIQGLEAKSVVSQLISNGCCRF